MTCASGNRHRAGATGLPAWTSMLTYGVFVEPKVPFVGRPEQGAIAPDRR